jgi:hypothetical protein
MVQVMYLHADARSSLSFSTGFADITEYSVVSTVEPPASHTANLVPGWIRLALSSGNTYASHITYPKNGSQVRMMDTEVH